MEKAIEINKISKKFYPGYIKALDDLSLDIKENKIYGLVGRNGSGKTTLLKTIACHLRSTSGSIKVFGEEPFENEKILSKICFVSDGEKFLPNMKIEEIFSVAKIFQSNWDEKFKDELLEHFDIRYDRVYGDLSKGMKAMVSAIIGLSSRAPITMYDEVYLGLDPVAREEFYKILLQDYERHPRCIIFSTHYLDEVSKLFENLIIMDKGKIILSEQVDDLKEKAFYIYGEKEKLEKIEKSFNVLNKEEVGKILKLAVFQKITYEKEMELYDMGIKLESMSLQMLFVNMIPKKFNLE